MLLGRSQDQLAEDRKVGNPPAFKKEGGSVRYRLGTVRDHMMRAKEYKNTEQARIAAEYNRRGYSTFVFWAEHAAPSDLWPCLIHHRLGRSISGNHLRWAINCQTKIVARCFRMMIIESCVPSGTHNKLQ